MSRSTVPVHIHSHLVPFFFQEFEGIEAVYLNKKVKAAKISTRKALGKIIRMLMVKTDKPEEVDKFHLYLSIQDRESSKKFFGQVYKYSNGNNSFLKLPEAGHALINDHLENIFRTAMIYFIEGNITENESAQIRKACDMFLQKYDLYEHGFENESVRRYYYRILEEGYFLKKLQYEGPVKFKKKDRKKFTSVVPNMTPAGQLTLF